MLLLEIFCRCCGKLFYLCRSCYRGQTYCCQECRIAGYLETHREAQRRYRNTEKGKKAHREAERKKRIRGKKEGNILNLINKTCICLAMLIQSVFKNDNTPNTHTCHLCGTEGKAVEIFPRRGYGHSEST